MIVDIWKPIFKGSKNNRQTLYYEMADINDVINSRKTGYIVRYTCDECKSQTIKTTTSSSLFRDDVIYNTINFQTCRSCRSRISESQVKKTQLTFAVVVESFELEGYKLCTKKIEFDTTRKSSQLKLKCLCKNNHEYTCTWNNWKKGKRCGMCYRQYRYDDSVNNKYGWELYKFSVWSYTKKNYKKYHDIINPLNLKRGNSACDYNVDHRFSVSEGFRNNVPPEIISSIYNLTMINRNENISKGSKCSITLEDLLENYNNLY